MIDLDRPVRVFKNWKHGCYSIMQDGVLRASAKQLRLGDVRFVVRASGRERMLREQRRNVHAFAVGRLLDYAHPGDSRDLAILPGRRAHYDPRRFAWFVDTETLDPVVEARIAHFDERGVIYSDGDIAEAA